MLYTNLSERDGGAIVAQLGQMGVPYRIAEGGGAILVPAAQVHEARLRLAAQGLPKGSVVGFELLENPKLGATQFQEQVSYQRALEGELARTIQSLGAVAAARVHLAIPRTTLFLRERQKPSASVMVRLHPGRTLDRTQLAGIVHLVASSVPELSARAVTVVDHHGTLLSAPGESPAGLDSAQLAYLHELEASYARRILDLVEPIVGRGNVRAQVALDVDFSLARSTAETFKPNQDAKDAAVRSQTTSESTEGAAAARAVGVPGTASNQPGAAPPAAPPAAGGSSRREATTNFELDKTVRVVRHATGTVKRVSAAVLVNHRRTTDAEGNARLEPLKEEELAQIAALAREAIGFSKERGDSLSVASVPFTAEGAEPMEEPPFWKRPEAIAAALDLGKSLLAALIVLAIGFGLVRPLVASLAAPAPAPPAPAAGEAPEAAPAQLPDPIGAARAIARQDPKIVANVVRSWVSKDG
ncbi:MAG: flagellar basal-body MS-ring/collar protein FliF [Burkholderiales bacterium]|nr:flagellar basal-body MS-ring/collar protein FliF [Burkholderiales bacterium]